MRPGQRATEAGECEGDSLPGGRRQRQAADQGWLRRSSWLYARRRGQGRGQGTSGGTRATGPAPGPGPLEEQLRERRHLRVGGASPPPSPLPFPPYPPRPLPTPASPSPTLVFTPFGLPRSLAAGGRGFPRPGRRASPPRTAGWRLPCAHPWLEPAPLAG